MRARRGANGESPTVSPPLAFPPPSARARERGRKCSAWPPRIGSLDGLVVRPARVEMVACGFVAVAREPSASKTTKVMGGDARRTGPCRPLHCERIATGGQSRTKSFSRCVSYSPLLRSTLTRAGHACTCAFPANWIPIVKKKCVVAANWVSLGGQFKQQPATLLTTTTPVLE
jgi:hypothetical protein